MVRKTFIIREVGNPAVLLLGNSIQYNVKARLPWEHSRNKVGFLVSISALRAHFKATFPKIVNILVHSQYTIMIKSKTRVC